MTEEILIDGVNVAGCEQIFAQKKCALLDQVYCEDNPDCYYKQLKRLEQENKELEEKVKDLDALTGIFSARLTKKYKSALEEIRNKIVNQVAWEGGLSHLDQEINTIINEVLNESK